MPYCTQFTQVKHTHVKKYTQRGIKNSDSASEINMQRVEKSSLSACIGKQHKYSVHAEDVL